jgi:hypothetical protein
LSNLVISQLARKSFGEEENPFVLGNAPIFLGCLWSLFKFKICKSGTGAMKDHYATTQTPGKYEFKIRFKQRRLSMPNAFQKYPDDRNADSFQYWNALPSCSPSHDHERSRFESQKNVASNGGHNLQTQGT